MTHALTLQQIEPVTHDTHHLTFPRPDGYSWTPGQATLLSLDKEGWQDEKRPFTFTSDPNGQTVEFVIKSYPDHDGVTEQIAKMSIGDQVIIRDAWGAIEDKGGPGVFLAGGAGITPFIGILRDRLRRSGSADATLIFSNAAERDIILRREWESMPGLNAVFTLTDDKVDGLETGVIDAGMIGRHVNGFDQTFYVCGPPKFEEAMQDTLKEMGVRSDEIVTEDH